MKNVEISITGLKCDHCDWADMSILFSDYEQNINRPCPNCGGPILTQEEYDDCVAMMEMADFINTIPPEQLPKQEDLTEEQINVALDFINKHKLTQDTITPDGYEMLSSK